MLMAVVIRQRIEKYYLRYSSGGSVAAFIGSGDARSDDHRNEKYGKYNELTGFMAAAHYLQYSQESLKTYS